MLRGLWVYAAPVHEPGENGRTDRETRVSLRNQELNGRAHWRHLANTTCQHFTKLFF